MSDMSDINVSPIQYTSRTYQTVINDINAIPELADKPEWWKRIAAGVADSFSLQLNAAVNDNFLRTAYTRRSVRDLVALIDYDLSGQSTASGSLTFNFAETIAFPVSINQADFAALSPGTLAVSAQRYETRQALSNFTPTGFSVTVNVTTNVFTAPSGTYPTGAKVRISSAGTLISPLVQGTSYYLIGISSTTFFLAESLENARAGIAIDITGAGTGSQVMTPYYIVRDGFQQETRDSYSVGQSDGITAWQEFVLDDLNVLLGTESVVINSVTWTRVENFVDSQPTDTHYKLIYNTDNSAVVQFGNGTFGAIPGAFDIFLSYAFGGGINANISFVNRITTYAGSDSNIDAVFNSTTFTGGGNPETIESAKRLAPILLRTRSRFVTAADGEGLVLANGGVSQARVNGNVFGVLSAQVLAIADGGGNPSSVLRTQIQTDLINRSILESIDVRVQEAVITSTNVTCGVRMLSGFSFSTIQPYVDLAWRLFLTETGVEITDEFTSNGIASAVTLINAIFNTSFTDSDYTQITLFLEEMQTGAQAPRLIGIDVQESEAFAFVAGETRGIDFITISAPTFPIDLADNEITTPGTITITEI